MRVEKNVIVLGGFILIFALGLFYENFKANEIEKFKAKTEGHIIKFTFGKNVYYIDYKYEVDGIQFEDSETVHYFECDDGNAGCVGEVFTIYYSTENPNFSEIDLGKFNDKKFK